MANTVSGALSHYWAGFMLNTYTHATAQMKQDAADTIGAVISREMYERGEANSSAGQVFLSGALSSFLLLFPCGSACGSQLTHKLTHTEKVLKTKENR